MKKWIDLLRIQQYVKNLFIFLPLFFAHEITRIDLVLLSFMAFSAFCLVASGVYILNDIHDVREDRIHPKKKDRSLATGSITRKQALVVLSILWACGFLVCSCLGTVIVFLVLLYVLLNIAYTFGLKHIPIIDNFIIALGFVIRIFVGGTATGVPIYPWIVIMTFFLAYFLALAKRRDDLLIMGEGNSPVRLSLKGYNMLFIQSAMVVMAAVIIVAYTMYTVSPEITAKHGTNRLYLTTAFVLLGLLRYLQITFVENDSGSPTVVLFKDHMIQVIILGWLLSFGILIYF